MSNYQKYSYKALLFWISVHNSRPISSATAVKLNKLKLQSIPLPWLAFLSDTYCGFHATYLPTCLYLLCWGHRHSVVFASMSLTPKAESRSCRTAKLLFKFLLVIALCSSSFGHSFMATGGVCFQIQRTHFKNYITEHSLHWNTQLIFIYVGSIHFLYFSIAKIP